MIPNPCLIGWPPVAPMSRRFHALHLLFLLSGSFASAQNPGDFYTRTGTDLTFQQLVDNGTIVPGESSSPGPVNGSTINVNNSLLEAQTGNLGNLPTDFRIHTQVNSSVLRANFGNFTRWYQEDGRIQVMRLFQGDQNARSGIGPDGTPGRIEAFYPAFPVPANKWSVWEGTYTIIDPLQSNIFQLFHEGGQLWAFHLRMTNAGDITFNRRRAISGLPTTITLATNMAGKSISFMVRSNGTEYELYKRTPLPLENWQLVTTGSYTAAVDRMISFRWGMYYGSQAGESIPNDGLLFVNGIKVYTVDAPGGDPPPPPPPVPMTYYWDNNGATAGFGTASGVWGETTSGGTQGWSTDATGATVPEEISTNSVDTLFFGTSTSGRGLGTGTITVSDTVDCADITFGSQSGNITLNGGEIQMFNNRTITVGGTGKTHTIRSVLSGTGNRTIAGGSTLSLTGANTFSGPLVIGDNTSNSLRLRISSIGNSNGTPSAAGAPTNSTNGIIQLGQTSYGSTLELTGSTSAQSTNRQIRIGSNGTGSGNATIINNNNDSAHTLTFTNSAFNVAATDTADFNRTLTLGGSNAGANIIQGAIIDNIGGSGGKVSLIKSNSGIWVLSGANTYTGGTSVTEGILRIGNGGSTGSLSPSSSISLSNGATLEFRRTGTLTQGTDFTSAAITGTGALVQSGSGTTILTLDNTYSGLTTINAGALRIQHAGALGSTAAGTVVNGSSASGGPRLELSGGITTVSGESVTISGGGNFFGALSSQSGTNTWAGGVTIAAPDTRIGAGEGATLRVSGVINSGGQPHGLIVRAGLVENGGVVLSAANTYLGDTRVFVGKLQLDGGNNRLPVGTRLSLGATTNISEFDLNGRNQTIAGLSIAEGATASNNSVNNSSSTLSTLTVNTAAGSPSTYSGILKGNLVLAKSGPDTLVLSGANTHTGGTTLQSNGGTIQAAITQTATALGTGPVSIGSGSTLVLDNQSTTNTTNLPTIANDFTGTGLLRLRFAAGTTSRNTYLSGVAGFGGTIQLSNAGGTGDKWNAADLGTVAGSLSVDSGSTIYVRSGSNTFAGGITLNGVGNSEGRGALRVAGGTTVLSGNISLASNSTIGMENTGAQITGPITSGAEGNQVLTLGGTQGSQSGGTLSGDIGGGTGILSVTVANGSYTLSGNLFHGGGINLANGLLTLSGSANTYGGVTAIGAGTGRSLLATAAGALGATGPGNETTIGASGQLGFSGGINYTAPEKIIGSGPGATTNALGPFLVSNRGFIQSVSGSNSFAGDIEITADCRIGTQDGASLTLTGAITQTTGSILFRVGNNAGDFVTLSNPGNSFGGDSTVFTAATAGNWAGLRLGADNALPANRTLSGFSGAGAGTALDLNGKSQALDGLIDGATLNIINLDTQSASTLTLNPSVEKSTTSTIIAGGGALGVINVVKEGAFTQAFAGPHGYTGTTTVNAGILRIDHPSALNGTSGITVNGTTGSALAIGAGITTGIGKSVTINGNGPSNAHGALTSAGGTSEWQGNVTIGSAGTRVGINSTAASTFTISGVIDSGGSAHGLLLRTRGPNSAIVLGGANTYLGETRIFGDGGSVRLGGGANRLPVTTTLRMGSGAVSGILDLNGQNQEVAEITVFQTSGTFANEVRSATAATLTVNASTPSSYSGSLAGAISLVKTGAETLTLTGTNTHTGPTNVNQGTLALVGASMASPITVASGASLGFSPGSPATSSSSVNLTHGKVKITGTVDGESDYLLLTATGGITGSPELVEGIPGYKLQTPESGTQLLLVHVGDYASWAEINAGAQGPELDFDFDGVPNGIEYFLDAPPGFTAMPTLDDTNTITWTNGGNLPASAYGTRFVIQTSDNLTRWDDVPIGELKTNTDGPGGTLSYTLSGPGSRFVRLKVMPE